MTLTSTVIYVGTSALMHSYDYGHSWRRTSGFEPFIEKFKDESKEGKFLHDYSLATFGGRYNRKHNSIDFFAMHNRKDFQVWRAPLLGSTSSKPKLLHSHGKLGMVLPRVASLSTYAATTFTTYPFFLPNTCRLILDFEGSVPQIAVIDAIGKEIPNFELKSSKVLKRTGVVSWGRNPPRSLTDHKFNVQTGVRFKIRTNEEPFHLFAIHCKDYETTEVLEMEAQKMSNLLLSNEHPKVSNENGYYQKSHYDILESRTKKVDHDFWKGRQLKSVYMLDIEFVEKTLSGQIHHKLIKPISPRNQSHGNMGDDMIYLHADPKSQCIYPQLVDMSSHGMLESDKECALASKQFPYRLYINAFPLKYLDGSNGLSHSHDFFNNVKLYVAKSIDDKMKNMWRIPRKAGITDHGAFCPLGSLSNIFCRLTGQEFRFYGSHSLRTSEVLHTFHLNDIWLYLILVPYFIFLLCMVGASNLSQSDRYSKAFMALKILVVLATFITIVKNSKLSSGKRCIGCLN